MKTNEKNQETVNNNVNNSIFDANGIHKVTGTCYDEKGYSEDFYYDEDGYDEDGYDKDGYDKDGYDRMGYDRDGYDRDGYDCYGRYRDGNSLAELLDEIYGRCY